MKTIKNFLLTHYYIFLVLFFCALKLNELGHNIKQGIIIQSTLDFSWLTNIIERGIHGYIAGKDFIYTYGPLFQLLESLPSYLFNIASYNSYLFIPTIFTGIYILLLALTSKLLIKDKKTRIIFTLFIIVLTGVLTANPVTITRILLPITFTAILTTTLNQKKLFSLRNILILSIPSIIGLVSFENFIYSAAITLLFSAYLSISTKSWKKLIILFFPIAFEIILSIIISGGFNYLTHSIQTVLDYSVLLNLELDFNQQRWLYVFPLGLIISIPFIILSKKLEKTQKTTLIFLIISAFFQFKTAIIRSDSSHVIMGTFPSIIILFTIVFLFGLKEKLILVIALILIPFTPHQIPIQNVAKSNFKTAFSILKNPEFFENFSLDKDYFYSQKEIEDMSRFIKKHPGEIMIFPYDNYLLNIAGETFNTYPEQFNVYTNSSVEKEAVKRLEKEPPKYIIFGPDDIGALRIDGMPNFTRNPLIAKWIIENYAVSETKRNYLILEYKKKKTEPASNVCNLFNIKTEIKDSNTVHILATFLKPPIYTMTINENTFRIPFKRNIDQYLIFTGKNISDYVNLFNSKIDFKKPKATQKNFKIEINKNVDIIDQNINFDQQKSGIQIECYN